MQRMKSCEMIYYNLPLARHQQFTPVREKEKVESLQEKKKKRTNEMKCKEFGLLFDDAMI